jgi:hypothetical protein
MSLHEAWSGAVLTLYRHSNGEGGGDGSVKIIKKSTRHVGSSQTRRKFRALDSLFTEPFVGTMKQCRPIG